MNKAISLFGHTHVKSEITDFPASMPASDVYNWAKQVSKPSYSYSEVGAAASDHTHSGYATTSALTSLTSRVTSLEGSVDMAKLVHTEYCDERLDGDTTVSTFVNADYIIIRPALPVILAASGSNAASAVNIGADYKIFKGCSGWGHLSMEINDSSLNKTSANIKTFKVTFSSSGVVISGPKRETSSYYYQIEFYKQ